MTDPFARLGVIVVRFRWPILAAWVIVLVLAGGLLAPRASKALKGGGFIDADSESARAAAILDREFSASTFNNIVVVFRSSSQTIDDPAFASQVADAADRILQVPGVPGVETYLSAGNPLLLSGDRHTTIAVVPLIGDEGSIQDVVPQVRNQLDDVALEHYVTGTPALNHDLQVTSEQDLQRSEIFTVPIVIILLLLVFRTVVAALLPLIVGAASIVLALAAIYLVSLVTDVSIFALNVTTMIGLGLGIDFSLVLANRFREEQRSGRSVESAVATAMATAGRSITYSALTVLIAMFVLTLLFNLFIVRSISLGVMLVAFTGLLAGLTLLPAVLAVLGPRLEWLRVMPQPRPADPSRPGVWYRLSYAIMDRPWVWLGASLAILLALALPVRQLRLYGSEPSIMPSSIESTHGVELLNATFGPNRLTPIQVVLHTAQPNGVWRPEFLKTVAQVTEWAANDPRSEQVYSLASVAMASGMTQDQFQALTPAAIRSIPAAMQLLPQLVNSNRENDTAVITIFSKYDRFSKEHQAFIGDLRNQILPAARQPNGVTDTSVGGDGAIFVDFRDATARRFPVLVAGVTVATFVMLMMFFQSIFLPFKAILMNFASILATYGVLVVIFQYGWFDRILGFHSLNGLGILAPPTLFAILFALSTDYEVFMLSRVKEYFHETRNNEEAVARGLQNTAGVITAAALILVGTFGSFASADVVAIKEIGIGLAVGVLLDSTIVRVVMVPASMRLAGNANWWMPTWLKRVVPELREGPALGPSPSAEVHGVYHLRAVSRPFDTDDIALTQAPLRIGRDASNDVQLLDERISRFHARVDFDAAAGTYVLTDLDSTNGVYVNGNRLATRQTRPLEPGDRIDVGGTGEIVLVFETPEPVRP